MPAGVRDALPRVLTNVESFADVTIRDADAPPIVVQVISHIWIYEDRSWMMAVHNANNPAINHVESGDDAGQAQALWYGRNFLRQLADGEASPLPVTA